MNTRIAALKAELRIQAKDIGALQHTLIKVLTVLEKLKAKAGIVLAILLLPGLAFAQSSITAKTCTLTMKADRSPDGTSGWSVQFRRNGQSQGQPDSSAPYGPRSATVNAGTYALTAVWTKNDTSQTQTLGTATCAGGSIASSAPPPPPQPSTSTIPGSVVYYVSPSGSDAVSCSAAKSAGTPRRTVSAGLDCLQGGDTLVLRAGTYAESLARNFAGGSSWASPTRVWAYPGESVWLKPAAGPAWVMYLAAGQRFVEFDGVNLDTTNATVAAPMGGLSVDTWDVPTNHIRYQNATVLGNRIPGDLLTSRVGIVLNGDGSMDGSNEIVNVTIRGSAGPNSFYGLYIHTSRNLVTRCELTDLSFLGLQVYDGRVRPVGNVITKNTVHGINAGFDGRRGGILIAGDRSVVANNFLYDINGNDTGTDAAGLHVYTGDANRIMHNTIVGVHGAAVQLTYPTNTVLSNNLLTGNRVDGIADGGSSGTVTQTNLLGGAAQFVSTDRGPLQFTLSATSPAVDAGTALPDVSEDINGVARPQGARPDIGATERVP